MGWLVTELLDADDVLARYGRWRPPSDERASARHRAEHAHRDFFDASTSRLRDFKEFGVGHLQYFHVLRFLAVLFGVLALVTGVPQMAVNLAGRHYGAGLGLEAVSLGNFGRTSAADTHDPPSNATLAGRARERHVAAEFMSDAGRAPATRPFNKRTASVALSLLDTLAALGYLGATLALARVCARLANEADASTVTIHDYSLRVEGLPRDVGEEELRDFLGRYGEVVSVELVRAYGALLAHVLRRGRTIHALQAATARLQKEAGMWTQVDASLERRVLDLQARLQEDNQRIQALQSQDDSCLRVVGAFVTFKQEEGKVAALRALPRAFLRRVLLKREHRLRGKFALRIRDAPEPSDVKYENVEAGVVSRTACAVLVVLANYTALALGFSLISLASTLKYNPQWMGGALPEQCQLAVCDYRVGDALRLSDANRQLYSSCEATGLRPSKIACLASEVHCKQCYCVEALAKGVYGEASYCSAQLHLLVMQLSSQVVVVVSILAINTLLTWGSQALTTFERHHTRSAEARSLAHKLFLAQFLNSAVSTILASACLPWLQPLSQRLGSVFFRGIYVDLTPFWYKDVGHVLATGQLLASALKVVFLGITWGTLRWQHRNRLSALTQQQLDDAWTGPSFDLAPRYGQHLSVVFVALLLSGGMPILYFSAALYFSVSYWAEKWELLQLCRRPVAYGADLAGMVTGLLPFAVVGHVGFSLWAFSLFGVPQSKLVTRLLAAIIQKAAHAVGPAWQSVSGLGPDFLARRLLQANAVHNLLVILVVIGVLVSKVMLGRLLLAAHHLLVALGAVADNGDAPIMTGAPEFGLAVRMQLLVGPSSYAIQLQPDYKAAFTPLPQSQGIAAGAAASPLGEALVSAPALQARTSGGGGGGGGGSRTAMSGAPIGALSRRRGEGQQQVGNPRARGELPGAAHDGGDAPKPGPPGLVLNGWEGREGAQQQRGHGLRQHGGSAAPADGSGAGVAARRRHHHHRARRGQVMPVDVDGAPPSN